MQVCLGTMQYGEGLSMQQGREQLSYAWSRGVNFFDTAEMYPVPQREASHGLSEQCVVRARVFVGVALCSPTPPPQP
jgi:aryl-alcohol dehydrogenase-like predicted oxidoreductase